MTKFIQLANGDFIPADQVVRIGTHAERDEYTAYLRDGTSVGLSERWRPAQIFPNHNPDLVAVFFWDDPNAADGLYLVFRDIIAWQQEQSGYTPLNADGLMNAHNPGGEVLVYNLKTNFWYLDGEGAGMTAESMLDCIYEELEARRKRREENDRQFQLTLVKPSEE